MTAPILTATDIRKTFGATVALADAQVELMPGEIHALMGENGSGKSTLLSILSGAQRPDSGRLVLRGEEIGDLTPASARALGIAEVNQEPQLAPALSVGEVMYLMHRRRSEASVKNRSHDSRGAPHDGSRAPCGLAHTR